MSKRKTFKRTGAFWAFVAPSVILFSVFFLLPLVLTVFFSFTDYDGYRWAKMDFVGISNYTRLLGDSRFWAALGRTFVFALMSLPFRVIIPLGIAVLVTRPRMKLKGLTRVMVYIPGLFSALVVGITFRWLFSQDYGLINFLVTSMGFEALPLALNKWLATLQVSMASNWASFGFTMILFIGGLNNIPGELYEAASIDGASGWQTFYRITVPQLAPTTFIVLLLSTINLLKEYALVAGLTGGGPGVSTQYVIQFIFNRAFELQEQGYGAAASLVCMFIFGIIAFIQFKFNQGGEVE